jgi:MFS family permease
VALDPVIGGHRCRDVTGVAVRLLVYGLALTVLIFTHSHIVVIAVAPVIAFGGGLTVTLPYAILIPLMPKDSHGILTGFYSLSRGLGVMLGPLLAGIAIQLLRGQFAATHGYAAMWIVTAAAIFASIPVLGSLGSRVQQRRRHTSAAGIART